MTKKEAVIFDFFDVVHQDPLKRWSKTHNIAYQHGISEIAFRLDTGVSSYAQYVADLAELGHQSIQQVEQEFAGAQLNHEMVELIKHLQKHVRTALLSNTSHEEIDPIFERNNLAPIFDEVIISSDTGLAKPDPAIYQILLKQLNLPPQAVVFIDDNAKNVAAAENMGMSGIVYQNMPDLYSELKRSGIYIDLLNMNPLG